MERMFLSITKGEPLRFLGHLDYLRTAERMIIRSGIPIAFSEGFNPHMKVAFDSALGVGTASNVLYMEIGLNRECSVEEIKAAMEPQLPPGISFLKGRIADKSWPKLMSFINYDVYEITGPVSGADEGFMKEQADEFNKAESFIYHRITPKGIREVDVKKLLPEPVSVSLRDGKAVLKAGILRSPESGTVKPRDVWALLAESWHMPWNGAEHICTRTQAFHREGDRLQTPFDDDAFPPGTGS